MGLVPPPPTPPPGGGGGTPGGGTGGGPAGGVFGSALLDSVSLFPAGPQVAGVTAEPQPPVQSGAAGTTPTPPTDRGGSKIVAANQPAPRLIGGGGGS